MSSRLVVCLSVMVAVAATLISVGCVFAQAEPETKAVEPETVDKIRARMLEILNDKGVPVMVLGTDDQGNPSVQLREPTGKVIRVEVKVGVDGSAMVAINDSKGSPVSIIFSEYEGQNGINVCSPDGAVLGELWGDVKETGFTLRDKDGVKRVGLGTAKGHSGIVICDDQGDHRLYFDVSAKGKAISAILAEEGKTAYRWTSDDK